MRQTRLRGIAADRIRSRGLSFEERRRGRLLPGFDADLVVLDRDPSADPPASVADARLVATMVAGDWLHSPGW